MSSCLCVCVCFVVRVVCVSAFSVAERPHFCSLRGIHKYVVMILCVCVFRRPCGVFVIIINIIIMIMIVIINIIITIFIIFQSS